MYYVLIRFVTRLTRRVPLVEQELLTLPEHPSSPPVFSVVRVARSLAWCVCFVDCCLSVCAFSFGHCVVCSSSIYGFWFPFGIFKLFLRTYELCSCHCPTNTVYNTKQRYFVHRYRVRQFIREKIEDTKMWDPRSGVHITNEAEERATRFPLVISVKLHWLK